MLFDQGANVGLPPFQDPGWVRRVVMTNQRTVLERTVMQGRMMSLPRLGVLGNTEERV